MTTERINQAAAEEVDTGDDRPQTRFVWISEAAMVVGCVLVFFGFLTALIEVFFPHGTSLLVDPNDSSLSASSGGEVELDINVSSDAAETLHAGKILNIQRRVQHRLASTLEWNPATVGEKVVRNDAVQTFSRSGAVMELNQESQLTMGENSLIVFDNRQSDPFLNKQKTVLLMVDGELSGRISSGNDAGFVFDVGLANSDITLKPRNPGDEVEFLITVNDDKSTTVNIHEGTAQVVSGSGLRTTIGDRQSVTINADGKDLRVDELAAAPMAASPADNSQVNYRNVPEPVEFRWGAVETADRYRIVIARDPSFDDRIVDDDVIGTSFTHAALRPGTYYWYVRSRSGWTQSSASEVRQLHVAQDQDPPQLVLDAPPSDARVGPWRLRGRTDSDASVFIDDVPVENIAGRIDHPIDLKPGANIIVVQAVDNVGNLSYAPLLVTAK